jgi:hypothetical protein
MEREVRADGFADAAGADIAARRWAVGDGFSLGRLRRGAVALLRRLVASDREQLCERTRLPASPARAPVVRARGGRGAAVPPVLPPRSAGPRPRLGLRRSHLVYYESYAGLLEADNLGLEA